MTRLSNTRGAMLIQVGISIAMLMGFAVFVVDYGVVWLARTQAQNAADASALSGAVSRAFDEFANPPVAGGMTEQATRLAAAEHEVFGAAVAPASVGVSYDCPPFVTGGGCVQADIFRNGTNGTREPAHLLRSTTWRNQPGDACHRNRTGASRERGRVHEAVGRHG